MPYPSICKPPTPYQTEMRCFGCTMCGERTQFKSEPVFGGGMLSKGKAAVGKAGTAAKNMLTSGRNALKR